MTDRRTGQAAQAPGAGSEPLGRRACARRPTSSVARRYRMRATGRTRLCRSVRCAARGRRPLPERAAICVASNPAGSSSACRSSRPMLPCNPWARSRSAARAPKRWSWIAGSIVDPEALATWITSLCSAIVETPAAWGAREAERGGAFELQPGQQIRAPARGVAWVAVERGEIAFMDGKSLCRAGDPPLPFAGGTWGEAREATAVRVLDGWVTRSRSVACNRPIPCRRDGLHCRAHRDRAGRRIPTPGRASEVDRSPSYADRQGAVRRAGGAPRPRDACRRIGPAARGLPCRRGGDRSKHCLAAEPRTGAAGRGGCQSRSRALRVCARVACCFARTGGSGMSAPLSPGTTKRTNPSPSFRSRPVGI